MIFKEGCIMNVVFASDDNYVPLLIISLVSFLKSNAKDFKNINVFILDDGISDKNINLIDSKIRDFNCSTYFIKTKNIDEMDIKIASLERSNFNSLTTYSRLFVSNLLPKNIDRVLYLDCDSLIVNSFKELWDLDISDYYCAGVLDSINTAVKQKLGFSKEDNHYNAGVLLINLKKWREDNVEEKFINFMIENQNRFYQHDQGVINNVFKNKIKTVDPKYNLQGYFQFLDYNLSRKFACMETEYYSRDTLSNSQKNPVFLHFCSANYFRPWNNPIHPYASLYEEYATSLDVEEVLDYSVGIDFKMKIFHIISTNAFGSFLLNLIPGALIRKLINKNALIEIDKENEKIQKL